MNLNCVLLKIYSNYKYPLNFEIILNEIIFLFFFSHQFCSYFYIFQYFRKPSPSDSDVSIDMVSPEMSFRSAVGTEVLFSELCGDEILKNESQK